MLPAATKGPASPRPQKTKFSSVISTKAGEVIVNLYSINISLCHTRPIEEVFRQQLAITSAIFIDGHIMGPQSAIAPAGVSTLRGGQNPHWLLPQIVRTLQRCHNQCTKRRRSPGNNQTAVRAKR